jgi:hypothetical protein
MMLRRKVAARYLLMKFYVRLNETTWVQSVDEIVTSFLRENSIAAASYSLNYKDDAAWEAARLRQKLGALRLSSFDYLSVDDAAVVEGVAIVALFRGYGHNDVYEFTFKLSRTEGSPKVFECQARALIPAVAEVLYGYARVLENDISPGSENRTRTTIFGGTKTKVDRMEDVWMQEPSSIGQGAIKGVYPLNLVTNAKRRDPSVDELLGRGVPRPVADAPFTILEYGPETLANLRATNKAIAAYIRD